MEPQKPASAPGKGAWPWIAAAVAALVLVAFLGGLAAAGWFRAKAEPSGPVPLRATAEPTAPPLRQSAQPAPDFRQAAPPAPQMPPEVRDWLEFLRTIEAERQELARSQVSKALTTLASLSAGAQLEALQGLLAEAGGGEAPAAPSPAQRARMDTEAMRRAWVDLHAKFLSRQPPAECQPIADRYDQVLRETGGMMGDILQAIAGAEQDPSSAISTLQSMKGRSKEMIDGPAREADRGVASICERYGVPKWFAIQSDENGGGIFQRLAF